MRDGRRPVGCYLIAGKHLRRGLLSLRTVEHDHTASLHHDGYELIARVVEKEREVREIPIDIFCTNTLSTIPPLNIPNAINSVETATVTVTYRHVSANRKNRS